MYFRIYLLDSNDSFVIIADSHERVSFAKDLYDEHKDYHIFKDAGGIVIASINTDLVNEVIKEEFPR